MSMLGTLLFQKKGDFINTKVYLCKLKEMSYFFKEKENLGASYAPSKVIFLSFKPKVSGYRNNKHNKNWIPII